MLFRVPGEQGDYLLRRKFVRKDGIVPGGPVVKNLPCNARDTIQSLLGELRPHVPWGN